MLQYHPSAQTLIREQHDQCVDRLECTTSAVLKEQLNKHLFLSVQNVQKLKKRDIMTSL